MASLLVRHIEHLAAFAATRAADRARAALRLIDACALLAIKPRLWDLQTQMFHLVESARADVAVRDALRNQRELVDALDRLGRSAFAKRQTSRWSSP